MLPLNGTREGLFLALFPLMPLTKGGAQPIVAMPNPFYQSMPPRRWARHAEPLYVPATAATGFLPDYAGLPDDVLKRIGGGLHLLALQSRRRGGERRLLAAIVRAGRAP